MNNANIISYKFGLNLETVFSYNSKGKQNKA
jgi:hypothetical protein